LRRSDAISSNGGCARRINIECDRDLDNYAVVGLNYAKATGETKANILTKASIMTTGKIRATAMATPHDWTRSVTAARNQRQFGIGQLNQIIHFRLLHMSPRLARMTR